uniref:hypothetical protein n=1 Tax=Vibrio anguillarum TaxID=55601 RepID=UPI001C04950A
MFSRTLLKQISSARNHRMLAEATFDFLQSFISPKSMRIFHAPTLNKRHESLFEYKLPTALQN